jgi:hypothetical protein
LESHQTTALVRPVGEHDRLDREGHAWWYVSANPISVGGAWSCFRRLRLGSSHAMGQKNLYVDLLPKRSVEPAPTGSDACKGRAMQLPKERSGSLFRRAQEALGLHIAETIEQQLA